MCDGLMGKRGRGRGGEGGGGGEGTNPVLFHPSFLCQVHFSQHKDSPMSWGRSGSLTH